MSHLDKLARLLLLAAAANVFAAEKIEIVRDDYGVPHIYARTPAGAAYGSGYAQAYDRGEQLLANLKSASPPAERSRTLPQIRAIIEAYCAGANTFFGENTIQPAMVEAFSRTAFGLIPESNDVLIAPSRSIENGVIAIISPSAGWSGAARLYAMEIETADGFAFAGMGPVGVPFPLLGHSAVIAIAAHGQGEGGPGTLDEAWALISAKTLDQAKLALDMGQFPRQQFLIGTASGEIFDSRAKITNPPQGILMSGEGTLPAQSITRDLLAHANTFSVESAVSLAYSSDVYKAETWLQRIAKLAPGSEFVRLLTGWNRRADAASRPALAFYLFKLALGPDAPAQEPSANLSDERLRAALLKAQDRFETEFPVDATYGSMFRIMRDGAHRSWPVGGGVVPQAGMATPRDLVFEPLGAVMVAHRGQAGLQVVALSRTVKSVIALPFGESDAPGSPHFEDQARELFSKGYTMRTWFAERKNLEKRSQDRKPLTAP